MSFVQKSIKDSETKNQNIVVAVRCRPRNEMEQSMNSAVCIECFPDTREIAYKSEKLTSLDIEKRFLYDRVFGPTSKQISVYKEVVAPLIPEVLMGYNCTVFAYGQTGTGKTYTMEGERSNAKYSWEKDPEAGIIPRCVHQLFEELHKSPDITDFSVRVSFLEIYNEELYDLLGGHMEIAPKPRMYEDTSRKGSVIINGLEEVLVKDKDQVYSILQKGAERRQFASTLLNAHSSRSHTVFSIILTMKESSIDGEDLLKTGKMYLVDLAGSENIGRSGAVDKRAREAGTINQSLLTLGRVINSLLEKKPHIPYRESKLTRLLQDSLGGKTKTCIIATISPAIYNIEETLSTLEYAQRAKKIKNTPQINQKLTQRGLIREYGENIAKLKADLAAARDKNGIYLTEERYNQMRNSVTVHKEMIAELEANLKSQIEEYDTLNNLFLETRQTLDRKLVDVDNSKKWIQHLREELFITLNKLSDKSMKIAECNFIINEFEGLLNKLHSEASELKNRLKKSKLNSEKLETKLLNERNLANKAYNASLEFDSKLSKNVEDIISCNENILSEVNEHKDIQKTSMDEIKNAKSDFGAAFKTVCCDFQQEETTLKNSFEENIKKSHQLLHEQHEEVETKLSEAFSFTAESICDPFINQNINQINSLKNKSNELVYKTTIPINSNTMKTISNLTENVSKSTKSLKDSSDFLKSSFDQFAISANNEIESLNSTFENYKNATNQLIDEQKNFLLKEISDLVDARFSCVSQSISQTLRDISEKQKQKLDQYRFEVENNHKTLSEIYNSRNNLVECYQDCMGSINNNIKNQNLGLESFYSDQLELTEKFKNHNSSYKESINKRFEAILNENKQKFGEQKNVFEQNLNDCDTCFKDHYKASEKCVETINKTFSETNQIEMKSLYKIYRHNKLFYPLVNDKLEDLKKSMKAIPENFRKDLLSFITHMGSQGDTPCTKKDFNKSFAITDLKNRDTLVDEFQENINDVNLTPTSKSTNKCFDKLENIADVSSIPIYALNETLSDESVTNENLNADATTASKGKRPRSDNNIEFRKKIGKRRTE